MYKILNKLFGWDYIYWSNFSDSGIARIYKDYMGRPYYWRYKSIKLADIIKKKESVVWLTCKPEKYFNN